MLLIAGTSARAQDSYSLDQLQGAWWSEPPGPTADFVIVGDQVWQDITSTFHPCTIEAGNILVFDLESAGIGRLEREIVSLQGDILELRVGPEGQLVVYRRNAY